MNKDLSKTGITIQAISNPNALKKEGKSPATVLLPNSAISPALKAQR